MPSSSTNNTAVFIETLREKLNKQEIDSQVLNFLSGKQQYIGWKNQNGNTALSVVLGEERFSLMISILKTFGLRHDDVYNKDLKWGIYNRIVNLNDFRMAEALAGSDVSSILDQTRKTDRTHVRTETETPLTKAVRAKNYLMVKALLKAGVNKEMTNDNYESPLFIATQINDLKAIRILLGARASTSIGNRRTQETPLHIAVENENFEAVCELLNASADANAQDFWRRTPLYIAAEKGNKPIAEALIAKQAGSYIQAMYGNSPLYVAAANGKVDLVDLLLSHGAEKNIRADNASTPLIVASQNGHHNVVKRLLEAGVSINSDWKSGLTALHMAAQNGQVAIVNTLIEHGANIYYCDERDKVAPLHMAAAHGHSDVVEALLNKAQDNLEVIKNWFEHPSITLKILNTYVNNNNIPLKIQNIIRGAIESHLETAANKVAIHTFFEKPKPLPKIEVETKTIAPGVKRSTI